VRLLPGQRYKMADGRQLTLSRVDFAGDSAILNRPYNQARWVLTRAAFDRAANVAAVEVSGGDETLSGELRITEPLVTQGVRVTLTDLFRIDQAEQALVGASLTVSANPLTPVFMSAYALWVAVYLALAILTWRERDNGFRPNGRA
jgi:hypothetical protein